MEPECFFLDLFLVYVAEVASIPSLHLLFCEYSVEVGLVGPKHQGPSPSFASQMGSKTSKSWLHLLLHCAHHILVDYSAQLLAE